jgi:hypothetical protein
LPGEVGPLKQRNSPARRPWSIEMTGAGQGRAGAHEPASEQSHDQIRAGTRPAQRIAVSCAAGGRERRHDPRVRQAPANCEAAPDRSERDQEHQGDAGEMRNSWGRL